MPLRANGVDSRCPTVESMSMTRTLLGSEELAKTPSRQKSEILEVKNTMTP